MIASRMKARIIDLILLFLFIGFFAIPLAALFWHQPKIFLFKPNASVLLFFFR
jgi:hypothetical protein